MHPTLPPSSRPELKARRYTLAILVLLALAVWLVPAGAGAAVAVAGPPAGPAGAALQISPGRPGPLGTAFAAAGAEFGVPPALLEAIGYVESHWESRQGAPNDYQQYGVMGLRLPPGGDTLPRAAALLGLPTASLQTDDTANIRGAAALLGALGRSSPVATAGNLAAWYPLVARYSTFADARVARSYAFSVFSVLRGGVRATTAGGETLAIAADPKLVLPDASDPLAAVPGTDDYPPAHWVAAAAGNFQYRRPYGPLNFIIIHDTEGSYQGAISWFQNPASGVSAHFVIRSSDGDITQMVHNADTAYHAGNWDYNVRAIGVEHEGYQAQTGWYTTAQYNASAALVRTMADRFSIPKDHAHIIGHYQVPNQPTPVHTDPGQYWNWASYLALVRNDAALAARVSNSDAGFTASPGIIDPQHGWTVYPGNGWNGGNAVRALSTPGSPSNAATWSTALPSAGLYDLYAYIPWVDNGRAETMSALYTVATSNGAVTVTLDQRALTTAGRLQGNNAPEGEWAHLGRFALGTGTAVSLNNATADSNFNVWFDAMMWIPAGSVATPTPEPTNAPTYTPTWTPTRTPTWTPTRTPTWTPTRTPTWTPTWTATPILVPTDTPTAVPTDAPTNTPTVTWTPGPCGMRFTDLPETDWAYGYVGYLYCHNIISGYGDGTFRGWAPAIRGQLAKMLSLGMGWVIVPPQVPTFSDVPADSPYFYYVENSYAHGAVSGYGDGTFRPYNSITRAQLSKMIAVAKGWAPLPPDPPSFNDVPNTYWAFGFIEAVHAQGVVGGYADGSFRPANQATRAQLSKMLSTAFQLPDGPTATPTAITPTPQDTPTSGDTATPTVAVGTVTPTAVAGGTVSPTVTATPGARFKKP